ncbi:hypothetical protein [Sphingomonas sp. PAMC 26621]|nr:hypothetical protein [Sphingomonas sp. PAMC 26621]
MTITGFDARDAATAIRKFAPTLAGLSSFMLTALVLLVSHHA